MINNSFHWSLGKIPKNNAFFTIGDIHGEWKLLLKMLKVIKNKISFMPEDTRIYLIFLGDYIDRGLNSKKCIEILSNLKIINVNIIFLCGNHDEIFKRVISCKGLNDFKNCKSTNLKLYQDLISDENDYLFVQGLTKWLDIGGGFKTVLDYCPSLKNGYMQQLNLKSIIDETFLQNLFEEMLILKNSIPSKHKKFFSSIYKNNYFLLGDYLFTHAGINPDLSMFNQGIGKNAKKLINREYIEFLMIRDKFLWRDSIQNCPYYVIHGHTPSKIKMGDNIISDSRKNYRICIDTSIYSKEGTLSCFYGHNAKYKFLSINKNKYNYLLEY
jgi:serine/threonine protein phosphatase 1